MSSSISDLASEYDIWLPDRPMSAPQNSLAVMAHADDCEIAAYSEILVSRQSKDRLFHCVIVTDGRNAPRGPSTKGLSEKDYIDLRKKEQIKAAKLGGYGSVTFLNYKSADIRKDPSGAIRDIEILLKTFKPSRVLTHNPFDKHKTHVAICEATVGALCRIWDSLEVDSVLGCEVWRDLDWLPEKRKIRLGFQSDELERQIIEVFQSQHDGVKDYVKGTLGRRKANSTFSETVLEEEFDHVIHAISLLEVASGKTGLHEFCESVVADFRAEVLGQDKE